MKNLIKITRNYGVKFCWQERHFLEKPMEGVPYANESKKVELTPKGKEKKEELNHQESITRTLSAIKIGAEKIPDGFEKIPASEFLKRGAEELQKLFIIDGIVNFHGNKSARKQIGLTDLFPKISNKQQFVILDGVNYAYGARRRDGKIGYGNPRYKAILGGESIEFLVAEKDSQSFVKNEEGKLRDTPEYENFAGFSADYLVDMEKNNLTPEEEKEEKKDFLSITQNKEVMKKTSYIDFKEMIKGRDKLEILKEAIAQGEGNYESHNNGIAGVSGEIPGGRNLTDLSLRVIMQYQQKPNRKLFSVGKYQFTPATLAEAVHYTGISLDTKFSAQTQEDLFPYLISAQKRPILNAYLMGKVTGDYYLKKAHKELSQEFASIAGPDGKGAYDGLAGNMALNNSAKISTILEGINEDNLA